MSEWTWAIKNLNGNVICTVKNVEKHGQLMSGRWLTVDIESATPLTLTAGCYLDYSISERYVIRNTADVEKCARQSSYGGAFIYKGLRLEDESWSELNDTQMCDYVYNDNTLHYSGLGSFSFYCVKASDFGYRVLANLENKYGENVWEVQINGYTLPSSGTVSGDYTFDEAKSVSISSGTSIKEALDMLWTNWGVFYKVEDHTVDIITTAQTATTAMSYGKGNGLINITRKINPNVDICTRVRAYGSERNMPYHWYNNRYNGIFGDAMYVPQLMLPRYAYYDASGSYLDGNDEPYTSTPTGGGRVDLWENPYDIALTSMTRVNGVYATTMYGLRDKEVHWNSDDMGEIFPSLKGMTASEAGVTSTTYQSSGRLDKILVNGYFADVSYSRVGATYEDGTQFVSTDTGSTSSDVLTSSRLNFLVRVPNPGFDPMAQKAEEDIVLLMQSGMCQARGFTVLSSTAVTNSNDEVVAYDLVCVRTIDDEIDQVFPNYNYKINAGDEYVYTGLSFSGDVLSSGWLEVYVNAAQQRLLRAAAIWLREHETEDFVYEITPDNIYLQNHDSLHLDEGDVIELENDFETTLQTIETITIKHGKDPIPTYEVTFLKRDESESLGDRVKGLVGQTIGVDSDIAKMNDTLYKKVNKSGFKTIFTLLKSDLTTELDINGDLSELAYIRANYHFFSVGAVSALGANSGGGGGGGANLYALLNSINTSSIGNVNPADNPQATGKCLVWNGSAWEWGTTGGGGGSSITTVSVPNGAGFLVSGSVSGTTLTLNTRTLVANDIPDLSTTYATKSYVSGLLSDYLLISNGVNFSATTGNPVLARFYKDGAYDSTRMASAHNKYIEWYSGDSYGWMNHAMGHIILAESSSTEGFKGQIWANTSGTIAFTLPSTSGTLALTSQLISGVTPDSYLKGYVVTHGTLVGTTIQLSRSSLSYIINGAGYTWWGRTMTSSGVVNGNMTNVGEIHFTGSSYRYIDNTGIPRINSGAHWGVYNEYNSNWPLYITSGNNVGIGTSSPSFKLDVYGNVRSTSDFVIGNGESFGSLRYRVNTSSTDSTNVNVFQWDKNGTNNVLDIGWGCATRYDTPTRLWGNVINFMNKSGVLYGQCTTANSMNGIMGNGFIGATGFMFYYESGKNTVWVTDTSGNAVNFASKGGVSALGLTGGSSSTTVGTLNVSTLNAGDLSVNGSLTVETASEFNDTVTFGNDITVNGYAYFTRVYLDSTRYIFTDGSTLKYYNGSTIKTISTT